MGVPNAREVQPVLKEILTTHDLQTITLRIVMGMLAEHFKVDVGELIGLKQGVRDGICAFLEENFEGGSGGDEEQQQQGGGAGTARKEYARVREAQVAKKAKAAKKGTKAIAKSAKAAKPGVAKAAKLSGLERAVILAEPLANFLGEAVYPRLKVAGRLTAYAKENNLQDPKNPRDFMCDDKLKAALGGIKSFTYFSVNKAVAGLMYSRNDVEDPELVALAEEVDKKTLEAKTLKAAEDAANGIVKVKKPKKSAKRKRAAAGDSDDSDDAEVGSGRASRKKAAAPSAFQRPVQLDAQLAEICGDSAMPISQITKTLWVYIKANKLQSPDNAKLIVCDDKLKALFGVAEVQAFGMSKYLRQHYTVPGKPTPPPPSTAFTTVTEAKDEAEDEGSDEVKMEVEADDDDGDDVDDDDGESGSDGDEDFAMDE